MNEINNLVFREGIGWRVPVFQDGDYALTMDSASLSTCQMVVAFGNYHRFRTNFLLPLKRQNFWQLHARKLHSFVILDLGDGKWQVQQRCPGRLKRSRFLVRIPGQNKNFTCLGLARNHLQYMYGHAFLTWAPIQRVPINIVHGKIADYLKSQQDKQIRQHFKAYGLVYNWWKIQENPSMQTRDIIDFIRLCHFPPAQLESCS